MRILYIAFICLFPFAGFSQEVLWSKNYGGSDWDMFSSIKQVDSTYIAVGHTQSNDFDLKNTGNSSVDGWILKIDADGNIIWSKKYGGSATDRIKNVQMVSDGLIFLAQSYSIDIANTNNNGDSDIWIFKTDFDGNIIWSRLFGSPKTELPLNFLFTKDSTLLITASSNGKGGDVPDNLGRSDLWVFEIDLVGNILWSNVFGGSGDDPKFGGATTGTGLASNKDGKILYVQNEGYIITSNSESEDGHLDSNEGKSDNWVFCINEDGELKWSHSFGSEESDELVQAAQIKGDLILFSKTYSSIIEAAAYKKINNEFDLVNNIGSSNATNSLSDGVYTVKGNLIFSGSTDAKDYDLHTDKGGIYDDGWVIKLNSKAELVWSKNYGGSAIDNLHKIEIFDTSGIIACGLSLSNDYDLPANYGTGDGWIIKIKDTCVTMKHEIDTFLCFNSYLLFQGDTIDQEGIYRDTFTAKTGCDSIITWNVEVYGEDVDSSINASFCNSFTLPSGKLITESGFHYDTLTSSSGCDSIIEYILEKEIFVRDTINASFCKSYTLPSGNVINQSGIYLDTLTSSSGCDSIIEYILEKEIFVRDTIDVQRCEFYRYRDGQVVRTDGYVTDTIFNSIQCDSLITYSIDILELDTTPLVLKIEEGQTARFRDTAFTLPGRYIYRQEKEEGCDNIYLIEVKEYRECDIYIPNTFSPNGDGINDLFSVSIDAACELFNFSALIFDRWGQKVAESRNPISIWEGDGYPSGVYVYFITYEYEGVSGIQSEQQTGTITIVR